MSSRKKLTALLVMIAMLLPAMPAIADPTATPPPLTGIAVDTQELNLLAGDSQVVTVSPIPADAEIETVDWDIDDEDIAELDLDTPEGIKGTVTVVDKPENNGKTTTITLQAKDAANQNVSTPVTVKVNVKDITSITPNQARYVLKPGEEISGVGVKLAPEGIKANIEWEENGAASIEFDENIGKVSVKDDAKDGDLMILTAKVDSAHTQNTALQPVTIEILVSQIIDKIVLKDSGKELKIGEKFNVEIATPSYSLTADDVEWESSNKEVAIVDANGIVTAVGSGKAIITVRAKKPYDGMDRYAEASIQITVAGEVTNDAITVDTDVIYVTDLNQQVQTVTATIKPVASKEVPFTVTGDNANCIDVALVETDPDNPIPVSGKIKFDSKGKAVLKISIDPKRGNLSDGKLIGTITIGGEGCTPATIQVYYRKNQMIITNITPEHKKVTLNLYNYYDDKDLTKPNGKTYQPIVAFTPSDATDRNLIWEVQEQKDPQGNDVTNVLEIDRNNGAVTPKNPGTAVVRVRAASSYGKDDNGKDIYAEAFITFNVYAKLDSTGNTDEILDVWQNQNGQPLVPTANPDKSYPNENAALPITIKGKHILQMQLNDPDAADNENWIWSSSKTTALKILTAEQDDPANNVKKGDYIDADGNKLPNGTIWLVSDKPGKGEITVRGEYSSQKRTFYFEVEEVVMTDFSLVYLDGKTNTWEPITGADSEEITKLPVSNEPSPVTAIGELGDVAKGRKIELDVKSKIPEATDQKVRWYSSNTKVATVSSKGVVTVKSDVGSAVITAVISYKETKQVGNDKVEETKIYAAAVKIDAIPVKEINDLTVYELNESGNRISTIISTNPTGQGGKIEFVNVYTSGQDTASENPLTLKLGESRSFEVVGAIHDLNRASTVKWKAHLSGYVTVKQTVKDGKTILTLKASTSGKKAGGTVRVVATNVGNYQNDEDTTEYFNYPEIYVKLEAEPPEEISIINVPKLLEVGQEEQLEIKTKPSNRDKTVIWSILGGNNDIAKIDPNTGVIRGLKQGVVTVVATTKDPNGNTITAEAEVQVGYKATGMKLNATSITLTGTEQFLLQVSAQPYALLEGQNIYFKVRDEEIAQAVVKDPQKPNEAVVSLYIPGNPQPKESTTIDVYVGGYEDPNDPTKIIGYQRKLTCRVKVGDTLAPTYTELEDKLSQVEITVKPTDVTIEVGKSKKITTTIKGLSDAEKKRIIAKWVPIDDTTQTSSAVVDVDDLGVITVKNNPAGDSAQVQAEFYYVDTDGQEYPIGPAAKEGKTIISEVVKVTVKPVLSAGITKENGTVLAEPSLAPELTIRKSDLPITITVQSIPAAKDLEVAPSYNTAFGKYLKAEERKQSDDKTAVTMDIEAQNVTFKKTKATVTFTEPTTKAKVVITLNILP